MCEVKTIKLKVDNHQSFMWKTAFNPLDYTYIT